MSEPGSVAFNPAIFQRPGGFDGGPNGNMCGAPHPDNPDPETATADDEFVYCRRLKGHQVRPNNPEPLHSAFVHSIAVPEEWDDPLDLDSGREIPF